MVGSGRTHSQPWYNCDRNCCTAADQQDSLSWGNVSFCVVSEPVALAERRLGFHQTDAVLLPPVV